MSRLFVARRRKTAATASEGSLPGQDRDSSSREWSRLEHLQSTPRSWREEDSVTQDRPLSSTPLTDKAAYPTTPDTGPSPFSPSVCVESDLSLADGSLVGRGEVAGGAVTRLHCRVRRAVQDLKVGGFTRPTRYHFTLFSKHLYVSIPWHSRAHRGSCGSLTESAVRKQHLEVLHTYKHLCSLM